MMFADLPVSVACTCLLLIYLIRRAISWLRLSRFSRAHGCKPVRRLPQTERIVGYDLYRADIAAAQANKSLASALGKFRALGNTWSGKLMGQYFLATIEPENVKAVLATQFEQFSLQERLSVYGPLIGRGIFTTDGVEWEHSRVSSGSVYYSNMDRTDPLRR